MRPGGQPAEEERDRVRGGVAAARIPDAVAMAIQDAVPLRPGPAQRVLHVQEGRVSGQVGEPRCRETDACLQSPESPDCLA